MVFNPCYKYTFWMRTTLYLRRHRLLRYPLYYVAKLILYHCRYKYGLSIPFSTKIGSGFYIGHFGNIVVNKRVAIGKNCNVSQGVTIGQTNRGERAGYPIIGDNVYIGPGAKIIGNVRIGSNVAIGANCVVTKDVPNDSVVTGVPGRVISHKGSTGYIDNTGYEKSIEISQGLEDN